MGVIEWEGCRGGQEQRSTPNPETSPDRASCRAEERTPLTQPPSRALGPDQHSGLFAHWGWMD